MVTTSQKFQIFVGQQGFYYANYSIELSKSVQGDTLLLPFFFKKKNPMQMLIYIYLYNRYHTRKES